MEEHNGYMPPASLNLADFQDAIGDAVVQAIINIGIRVNRDELLKALKYDRAQYKAGYDAGFSDGLIKSLHTVRCRDCINYNERRQFCEFSHMKMQENGFCSYGKRNEE